MNDLVRFIKSRIDMHVAVVRECDKDHTPENLAQINISLHIKYELRDILNYYYASNPDPSRSEQS